MVKYDNDLKIGTRITISQLHPTHYPSCGFHPCLSRLIYLMRVRSRGAKTITWRSKSAGSKCLWWTTLLQMWLLLQRRSETCILHTDVQPSSTEDPNNQQFVWNLVLIGIWPLDFWLKTCSHREHTTLEFLKRLFLSFEHHNMKLSFTKREHTVKLFSWLKNRFFCPLCGCCCCVLSASCYFNYCWELRCSFFFFFFFFPLPLCFSESFGGRRSRRRF